MTSNLFLHVFITNMIFGHKVLQQHMDALYIKKGYESSWNHWPHVYYYSYDLGLPIGLRLKIMTWEIMSGIEWYKVTLDLQTIDKIAHCLPSNPPPFLSPYLLILDIWVIHTLYRGLDNIFEKINKYINFLNLYF